MQELKINLPVIRKEDIIRFISVLILNFRITGYILFKP